MPIRQLDALLVNQIAAGEVIERPASVVKELLDNALDAAAARIDVQVAEGGRELVRVADDGAGIPADELALALAPHATSKIAVAADLEAIRTYGFRGEALASIASVSRLRLTSRARGAEQGATIEAAGDEVSPLRPAASATGTIVEVRNLFFNTPARRKFMRAAATEFTHVADTVSRLALSHPAVGFKLTHEDRATLDLPPGQTPRRRAIAVLGSELEDGLLEFDSEERGLALWGLAGVPALARATARYQYLYINGRPVRDRQIAHAVREAYRGLIDPHLQPTLVLFLAIDPAMVDVNVHPTKSEVRFRDAQGVHGVVLATIRRRLLAADLTPRAFFTPPPIDPAPMFSPVAGEAPAIETGRAKIEDVTGFVDYFRQLDPTQKSFAYEQVRREMTDPAESPEGPALTPAIQPRSTTILQVHNAYIVTQDEGGIVIIDQHALHERMMFEGLYDRICKHGSLESQRLITPAIVKATPSRMEALQRVRPLLEKIGVEAEPMGPATIGVHAFATLLFDRNVDPVAFVEELLDRAADDAIAPEDEQALHTVLDMMSCKAAVKAGDALRPDELSELLARREHIERAASCPHGRPTAIRLTLRDLERQFKRT